MMQDRPQFQHKTGRPLRPAAHLGKGGEPVVAAEFYSAATLTFKTGRPASGTICS